jgi:hypothetical protein
MLSHAEFSGVAVEEPFRFINLLRDRHFGSITVCVPTRAREAPVPK